MVRIEKSKNKLVLSHDDVSIVFNKDNYDVNVVYWMGGSRWYQLVREDFYKFIEEAKNVKSEEEFKQLLDEVIAYSFKPVTFHCDSEAECEDVIIMPDDSVEDVVRKANEYAVFVKLSFNDVKKLKLFRDIPRRKYFSLVWYPPNDEWRLYDENIIKLYDVAVVSEDERNREIVGKILTILREKKST